MVLDDVLYLVGRGIAGLTLYSWRPGDADWTLEAASIMNFRPFADKDGWAAKAAYWRSIQVVAAGGRLYAVGRNKRGLFTYSWSPSESVWKEHGAMAQTRLFTEAAWENASQASTIHVTVHRMRVPALSDEDLRIIDEYDEALDVDDPAPGGAAKSQGNAEKKARQDKLKAHRKSKDDPVQVRETLFLVARDDQGLSLYALDLDGPHPTDTWRPVPAMPPSSDDEPLRCTAFSNANGGDKPGSYETIGVISTPDHGLLVYGCVVRA